MYKTNRAYKPPRLSFAEELFLRNRHAKEILRFLLRIKNFSTDPELDILRKIHLELPVDTKSEEIKNWKNKYILQYLYFLSVDYLKTITFA
jgi:hypothetical protein